MAKTTTSLTSLLTIVLGIALAAVTNTVQAQVVSLIVGDGVGVINVTPGVEAINLNLTSNPTFIDGMAAGGRLVVTADDPGDLVSISLDPTAILNFTFVPGSSNQPLADLNQDFLRFGNTQINTTPFFLHTLLLDTSSLNVGDSFALRFDGSVFFDNRGNQSPNYLAPTSPVTVNVVAAIPEPTSLLFFSGLLGLCLSVQRRRKMPHQF